MRNSKGETLIQNNEGIMKDCAAWLRRAKRTTRWILREIDGRSLASDPMFSIALAALAS